MNTTPPNLIVKKNIGTLVDSICEAYAKGLPGGIWEPKYVPGHGLITYCNEAVNYICKAFGYAKFDKPGTPYPTDAILANEQFDIMSDQAGDWIKVTAKVGQDLANQGAVVVAAIQMEGHGHVTIIRPGNIAYSGTWKTAAPKCMNIGKNNFIDKKASWAFRAEPKFFTLKESDGNAGRR